MILDAFEQYFSDDVVDTFKAYIRAAFPRNRALMFSAVPRTLQWKQFAGEVHLFRRHSPMVLYGLGRLVDKERIELRGHRAGIQVEVAFIRTKDILGMASLLAAAIPPPDRYPSTLVATAPLPAHDRGLNLFWDAKTQYPSVPLDVDDFQTGDFVLVECRVVRKRFNRSCIELADEFVATEMEFRYSKALRPFVVNGRGFRDMLNNTGSVISGSFAVAITGEHQFQPGDLDIYTTEQELHTVIVFLQQQERFVVVSEGDPHIEDYSGGAKRLIRLRRDSTAIDIIVSLTQSPTLPIAHFWSTPVMLFLSGDAICLPYPTSFEKGLGLLNPGRLPMEDDMRTPLVDKYQDRGFKICEREVEWYPNRAHAPPCGGPRSPTCPVNVRHFGDRLCLTTSLKTVTNRSLESPFQGVVARLTTVWWRGGTGCGSTCNMFGDTVFTAWTQTADMVGL
ncbi:hypothetical protein GSI_02249 [Ganoderma sinense ZZ0214-1]|uniref:Uncharacterized protein n=1 Tax=Ganoderma sinense ZZ0214-1 TaxID=1077348 RepID=A0A2G8SP33_9APHY|nr:hypothetical protein GSI_02249 [Ganoderma sinense ZZ0214-1]